MLVGHAHISSKGGVWNPFARGTWRCLLHHTVNLFERQTLGLGNQEVCIDEASDTEGAPNEENSGLQVCLSLSVSDHVWSDDSDNAVPKPVRGGRESNTTGTDRKREYFTNNNPSSWSPSCGKEEDVNADEGNLGGDSGVIMLALLTCGDTDNTNDKLADKHAKCTPNENCSTTQSLNDIEGNRCRTDVDEGSYETNEEGVFDCAELLEERRSEVEDEIDSGPLLHHLK